MKTMKESSKQANLSDGGVLLCKDLSQRQAAILEALQLLKTLVHPKAVTVLQPQLEAHTVVSLHSLRAGGADVWQVKISLCTLYLFKKKKKNSLTEEVKNYQSDRLTVKYLLVLRV